MSLDLVVQVKQLREQLIKARKEGDVLLLDAVESGLRDLGSQGYRCCLLDYEACNTMFYVRLLGYEKGRVEAELEFPISPELNVRQWLPLSHLADYNEAQDRDTVQRIYLDVSPFIQQKSPLLQKVNPNGHTRLLSARSKSSTKLSKTYKYRTTKSLIRTILWWLGGGVIVLTVAHVCLQVWSV